MQINIYVGWAPRRPAHSLAIQECWHEGVTLQESSTPFGVRCEMARRWRPIDLRRAP
jgi:hypothetical protein